ncbi:MAG: acetate kinase [Dokdonella sp.]
MNANSGSRNILALNVGSDSLKAASYALPDGSETPSPVARETGRLSDVIAHRAPQDVEAAWRELLADVAARLPGLDTQPDVVVHRIVHGADRDGPTEMTPDEIAQLGELSSMAPLHQPRALALIRAAMQCWPAASQVGVFDTSWHQTMPEKYRVLPIPHAMYARGVKRYGFHGLAFQSAMRELGRIAPEISQRRIVLAHLGGGSSLCAVRAGLSVNTTMGMTPLGGIPMETRTGSMDPGVLLHLQRSVGMKVDQIDQLLWRESGMKGLSGESGDMRHLLASNSSGAGLALDVYVAGVVQGIAAMAACIQGIDALVFSGGIGTHAPEVRARVVAELQWLGLGIDAQANQSGTAELTSSEATTRTFAVAVDEEREMADAIVSLPKAGANQSG